MQCPKISQFLLSHQRRFGFRPRAVLLGTLQSRVSQISASLLFLPCSHTAQAGAELPNPCVTITPPPVMMSFSLSSLVILAKTVYRTLVCQAPLIDAEFQLRPGEQELNLPSISTSPKQIKFYLKLSDMGDQSPFTCCYRLLVNSAW